MTTKLGFSLIVAGLSLGTAWAIRGQFGHEQGAAWAGAMGALSIILLAKREDWYAKIFQLTLASAAGWGVGGIISYGLVVGYGRALGFGNAYYGLLMLFVIGSLFGLLGGGLFGLMLADRPQKPVKCHALIVEMTAGAFIFYYLLIEELGWLMTPPRSEAWAAVLGMAVAMFWYMIRQQQYQALRVAVLSGLGGGFGFAFGNFLQIMGHVSGINFNFWNVMEYSIGFFGGVGMAYGTLTSIWPESSKTTTRNKLLVPLVIIGLIIPFFVWDQSFTTERFAEILMKLEFGQVSAMTQSIQWVSLILILINFAFWLYHFYFKQRISQFALSYDDVRKFFLCYLGLYTVYSVLITCAFLSLYRIEQYLYFANLLVIALLIGKAHPSFSDRGLSLRRWTTGLFVLILIIGLLTAIAINSHGLMKGAHDRF